MTDRLSGHREELREGWRQIPRQKIASMILRTIFGLGFAAAGPAIHLWVIDIPWWAVLGFVFVGAVTASGQLLMAPVRFAVAALKDLLAAVRSK